MTKDAKPDAWMPLYIGDYRKDTGRLNAQQHGAYLLLIMEYWVNGPPADDDEELAKIAALDLRDWKRIRGKIARFFEIADGVWRHKRVERELETWTEKRRKHIEKSRRGGEAKAARYGTGSARGSATGKPQAVPQGVPKGCPSASPGEEEGPNSPSSLTEARFQNRDFRDEAAAVADEAFLRSYLDPCRWVDVPEPTIIAPHELGARKLIKQLRRLLAERGITVTVERAA